MNRLLLLFFLSLISINAFSQFSVKGYVIDETGDPIKFAHIQAVQNQQLNTSANEVGEFEIQLPAGMHELRISAYNYSTITYDLEILSDTADVQFVLIHTLHSTKEVVVYSGEDPGVKKMREVIKRRPQHAAYLQNLTTNVYLKGNLKILDFPKFLMGQEVNDTMLNELGLDSNRQGIVYLLEQHTKYYYQYPDKTFNEVLSVRTSGDPQGLGFAQMPPIINIYENNIDILAGLSPRGIISPAHSNAFYYYTFKLEDSYFEGDKMISKIKVTPKRKFEPLFTGYVYVVEDDWTFHSLELTIDRSTGIDLLDTLKLIQTYSNFEGNNWIIQNQVIEPKLQLLGITIGGSFLTHYTHESINKGIDQKIFNTKIISVYDSTALDKDSLYWSENRKIPLTELEEKNFVKGDSLFKEIRLQDSIYNNKTHVSKDLLSITVYGFGIRKGDNHFKLNGLIDMIQFNNVEGLNLTLKPTYTTKISSSQSLQFGTKLRYGFASKTFYSSLFGNYKKTLKNNKENYYKIHVEGGNYINDITNLMPISEIYNTYTALSGRNYLSFYERTYANASWEHSLGNGFKYSISATHENRKPLENNTNYTWFQLSDKNIQENNPSELPVFTSHKAFRINVNLEYQPGWRYIQYPKELYTIKSSAPIFRLNYEKGIPSILGSEVDYDKLSAGMKASVNMKLLGRLDINAEGGGFLSKNKIGNPDFFHVNSNQIWLASSYLNSFQLANYYELSHNRTYGKIHAEWHLNGFISNKIPVIKKLNWHFVLANNTIFHSPTDYYTETSFGMENIGYNIYRFGRVDFVFGYNSMLQSKYSGIRIGFSGILNTMVSVQ